MMDAAVPVPGKPRKSSPLRLTASAGQPEWSSLNLLKEFSHRQGCSGCLGCQAAPRWGRLKCRTDRGSSSAALGPGPDAHIGFLPGSLQRCSERPVPSLPMEEEMPASPARDLVSRDWKMTELGFEPRCARLSHRHVSPRLGGFCLPVPACVL